MDCDIRDRLGLMRNLQTRYVRIAIATIPPSTPPAIGPALGPLLLPLPPLSFTAGVSSVMQTDLGHCVQSTGIVYWQTCPSPHLGHSSFELVSHCTQPRFWGTSFRAVTVDVNVQLLQQGHRGPSTYLRATPTDPSQSQVAALDCPCSRVMDQIQRAEASRCSTVALGQAGAADLGATSSLC